MTTRILRRLLTAAAVAAAAFCLGSVVAAVEPE